MRAGARPGARPGARLPPGDACFSLYRWIWLRSAVLGTNSLTGSGSPVTTVDGMTYERYAIETWLQANNTSPLTGEPLPVKLLVPNTALRSQIQRYREKHASPGGSRTPGRAPGRAPARSNGGGRGY